MSSRKDIMKIEEPDYDYLIDTIKLTFTFNEKSDDDEETHCIVLRHISEIVITKVDKHGWKYIKIYCSLPTYATTVYDESGEIDKLYKEIIDRI